MKTIILLLTPAIAFAGISVSPPGGGGSYSPTTVGGNIDQIATPGAQSFIRIETNGTITLRTAAQLAADIGVVSGTGLTSGHLIAGAGGSSIQEAGSGAVATNAFIDNLRSGSISGTGYMIRARNNGGAALGDFWMLYNGTINTDATTYDNAAVWGHNPLDAGANYNGKDGAVYWKFEHNYLQAGNFQDESYIEMVPPNTTGGLYTGGNSTDSPFTKVAGRPLAFVTHWGFGTGGTRDIQMHISPDVTTIESPSQTVAADGSHNGPNFPYFTWSMADSNDMLLKIAGNSNGFGKIQFGGTSGSDWLNDSGHSLIRYGSSGVAVSPNDINATIGETQSVGNSITLRFGAGNNGIRYNTGGNMQIENSGTWADIVTTSGTQALTNKTLASLTSNGFVKTSSGNGTLSVDTGSYVPTSTTVAGHALSSNVTVAEADLSFTDITTNNVSTTKHGFVPKLPNDATKYLDGTGAFSVPAGSGGGGSPGGSTTQVQFNDAGAFAGNSGYTYDKTNEVVTLGGATITANKPVESLSETWNNSGVTFQGWLLNITKTAAASGSKLADFQVAGSHKFGIDPTGAIGNYGGRFWGVGVLTSGGAISAGLEAVDNTQATIDANTVQIMQLQNSYVSLNGNLPLAWMSTAAGARDGGSPVLGIGPLSTGSTTLAIGNGTAGDFSSNLQAHDVFTNNASFLIRTKTTITGGGTSNVPTLTAGPVTGNPTKWIPIDDNGTTRYLAAW